METKRNILWVIYKYFITGVYDVYSTTVEY
jgi:hypothetical protein